jgi:hypothetical protein
MDIILLLTCAAILLIDLKIKEDVILQAQALQRTIDGALQEAFDGQGTKEPDRVYSGISGDILSGDDSHNTTVASEDLPKANSNGSGRTKGRVPANRRAGNNGAGIPSESE